jgi:hypothetical protein
LKINRPTAKVVSGANRRSHHVYPAEVCLYTNKIRIINLFFKARMGKSTYSGTLEARIHAEIFDQNGKLIGRESYDRVLGSIPVMVRV